jgi:CO/xanthine dehydrogenase FAD-binding subunit
MKTSRAKSLAAFAVIAVLAAGCDKEPVRIDAEIPSGGQARDAWAAKVAKDNGVDSDLGAAAVAQVVCSDILPKHDKIGEAAYELAKWRSVSAWDASDLIAIAIYGYCPEYKPLWEGDAVYKSMKVEGVTPLFWK